MTRADIIRMAWGAGARPSEHPEKWDVWEFQNPEIERFYHAAFAAGEQAERDRRRRLVEDMEAELRQRRMTGENT